MAFDEVRFPTDISRNARSSQTRLVEVITLRSGYEERNAVWADSRRTFDIGLGLRNMDELYQTMEFWEARRGRHRGFRFKDWTDFRSGPPNTNISNTDQALLLLTSTTYQLQKVYSAASNPWTRTINKPVAGSLTVRDSGGPLTEGVDFTVDTTTGILTFSVAPTSPTAGFEFDVPVRFMSEELTVDLALFNVGDMPSIELIEIRV